MRREAQAERADDGPLRGAARRFRRSAVIVACAVAVSSCGGAEESVPAADEQRLETPSNEPAEPVDEPPGEPPGEPSGEPSEPVAEGDEVAVPVARFVAAGPGEPNTFGPMCATEIDGRGDDMFRITVPGDWSWSGSSGGSGPDEVDFETPFGRVTIEFFRSTDELSTFGSYVTVGEAEVGTVSLEGEEFPLVDLLVGEEPGVGFTGVPYLGPLPITGTHEATVVMSSPNPIDPELAAAVLSTVRPERCGVVEEAAIWGPGVGVLLVPRFEPDPLAKAYPDDAQPQVSAGQFGITYLSLEQVSYLLSFDESTSSCMAPLLVDEAAADPIVGAMTISPANAPAELIDELIGECS